MEGRVIPEPQRTYFLELLDALGPAADDFVVAGAQAMKFVVEKARATKDVDFLLNVLALRKESVQLAPIFEKLGYMPLPESRNFQFAKAIPGSAEKMRIEFMAPEEYKREKDFRVDIQDGVHARACTGGSIALAQCHLHTISGKLPTGVPCIVTALPDVGRFSNKFLTQFLTGPQLGIRVLRILADFFRHAASPGLIVHTEYLAANLPAERATAEALRRETETAQRIVAQILPAPEFLALAASVEESTEIERGAPFVEEYLLTLESARIPIADPLALTSLPGGAFSGAYKPGAKFVMSASEPLQKISDAQRNLLHAYLQRKLQVLQNNEALVAKFPHTLKP